MEKRIGKKYRYMGNLALILWILAGLFGCGMKQESPVAESGAEESTELAADENAEVIFSLQDGEICSIWTENDVLYAFVASKDRNMPYGIYEVRDGSLLEETPYSAIMESWNGTEMKKTPAASYEYEARLGRNDVLYLLGRNQEGNVKRCYWMEKSFYTDIPFYEKYQNRVVSDVEISKDGSIYLESGSGGYMIPYDDFYGRIGVWVNSETGRTILGERRMYQLAEGGIYVWDFPSGASMEVIRCDVLTNGNTPVFIDKSDGIYLVGSDGLAYLPYGGSIWEILADREEMGIFDNVFDLKQIWVCGEDLYLTGIDTQTGQWQIRKKELPGKGVKK